MASSIHMDPRMASRAELANPYLDTDRVKLEGRSREQLFVMLYRLSRQFWYFDKDDTRKGDWSTFFEKDLTSLLIIQGQDRKNEEFNRIVFLFDAIKEPPKKKEHGGKPVKVQNEEYFRECLDLLVTTVLAFNSRYQTFTLQFFRHPYQVFLQDMISGRLSFELNRILQLYLGHYNLTQVAWMREFYQQLKALPVVWGIGVEGDAVRKVIGEVNEENIAKKTGTEEPKNKWEVLKKELTEAFRSFYDAYAQVVSRANECLQAELVAGNTQPHVALMLVFLKLYQHQQRLINKLPDRYLDFYYRDVLQFKPEGIRSDQAYVLFTLNEQADFLRLEKGTLLSAGETEAGDPITFATENEALLSSATLSVLNVAKRSDEGLELGRVENFQLPQVDEITGQLREFSLVKPKSLITGPEPPKVEGFAISSPDLYLQGGLRTLKLSLSVSRNIARVVLENSSYYLTIESGWFLLESPNSSSSNSSSRSSNLSGTIFLDVKVKSHGEPVVGDLLLVELEITLPVVVPPIVGYEEDVHGPGYETRWPVFRCDFKEGISQKESKILVNGQVLSGEVNGFRDLHFFTPDGEITQEAGAVSVLGSEPAVNSQFIVGTYEPFIKQTTTAKIEIDWPTYDFEDHYRTYIDYENRNCIAVLEGLSAQISDILECIKKQQQSYKLPVIVFGKVEGSIRKPEVIDTEETLCMMFSKAMMELTLECNDPQKVIENYKSRAETELKTLKSKLQIDNTTCPVVITIPSGPCEKPAPPWAQKDQYKAKLDLLVKGKWKEVSKNEPLFKKEFRFISSSGEVCPNFYILNPPVLDQNALSGFFRFTLTHPADPFANRLYPNVLNWVVMKNTSVVANNIIHPTCPPEPIMDLPNLPIVPAINSMSLCYEFDGSAKDNKVYLLEKDQDGETLPVDNSKSMPEKKDWRDVKGPTALLGFTSFPTEVYLSLFFGIETGYKRQGNFVNKPTFHILTSKGWEQVIILNNTTNNWQEPGIVTLKIDHPSTNRYEGKEDNLYWLKLTLGSQKELKLTMLATNVVKATRVIPANGTSEPKTIPAQTISELLADQPEIDTIIQPYDSFGYQSKESTSQFRQRVSNRLRFKGRATSVLACQQLILGHFKNIFQVNVQLSNVCRQRKVTIYIVPQVDAATDPHKYHPRATIGLVRQVEAFLSSRVSDLVKVTVTPAKFQKIRILADVCFKDQSANEKLTSQLNTDLDNYLSPWITGLSEHRPIQYLDTDDLRLYVLDRPYIDQLNKLEVYQPQKGCNCVSSNPSSSGSLAISQCEMALNDNWCKCNENRIRPSGLAEVLAPDGPHCIISTVH